MAFPLRRLLRSTAYFVASFAALALFFIALLVAESTFYALTGHSLSTWALILAALFAALVFSPLAHLLQHLADRLFFKRHLDTLAAIQQLGAGDLAALPAEDVERALLARICTLCYRTAAALDERHVDGGGLYRYPGTAPEPPVAGASLQPVRLRADSGYELCLPLRFGGHDAWLFLGPRTDGWPTDDDELEALQSLARFAAMSLEHARLSQQQANAARLDSLSRVAGQLHSHDLKNRLHDLAFLAHNLEARELGREDAARLIASIRKVVGRMQTLFKRLADPNAAIEPVLAPLNLNALIRDCADERLWPEGVHVRIDLPELPLVLADADMLRSVFETLFDNAVQAMQSRGDIRISGRRTATQVELCVHDTGCGIPEDFLHNRLFRMFATSKPNGLGIGLYLSRRMIEAHGGKIFAESAGEGKGCTFHVVLPVWQGAGKNGGGSCGA